MRIGLLCATALLTAMPANAQESFCKRVASQTGMTAAPSKAGEPPSWSTRVLNIAQRFLVGGQSIVMIQVLPAPNSPPGDHARFDEACQTVGKTVVCTVDGPAEFRLAINGKEVRSLAQPGDHAKVMMAGTRLSCGDVEPPKPPPAPPQG